MEHVDVFSGAFQNILGFVRAPIVARLILNWSVRNGFSGLVLGQQQNECQGPFQNHLWESFESLI